MIQAPDYAFRLVRKFGYDKDSKTAGYEKLSGMAGALALSLLHWRVARTIHRPVASARAL